VAELLHPVYTSHSRGPVSFAAGHDAFAVLARSPLRENFPGKE
jgi:hypothetical protein